MGAMRHEGYSAGEPMPPTGDAIDRAAHTAIRLASKFPGSDGVYIRATSEHFGVSILDTVDRINATRALISVPDVEGYGSEEQAT